MALITLVPAADAASAAARALEATLGHGMMLSVGDAGTGGLAPEALPGGDTRAVALPFGDGAVGEITLVVSTRFAASVEAVTSDASLLTAALPPLHEAAAIVEAATGLRPAPEYAAEIATDTLLASAGADIAVVPITEDDEPVACLVVRIVASDPAELIEIAGATADAEVVADSASAAPVVAVPTTDLDPAAGAPVGVATYEFPQLSDGNRAPAMARPIALLNDVRMEVVAELGSTRVKVRDLVNLAPGSVVHLDRTAGSPVDVIVNGTLLARAEVVVVDEEFGIRVSEIVVGDD